MASNPGGMRVNPQSPSENWPSKIGKLIPAEALALYGFGSTLVPPEYAPLLWLLAVVSMVFIFCLRYVATKGQTAGAQWWAIIIAEVSFVFWLLALKPPIGPIDL